MVGSVDIRTSHIERLLDAVGLPIGRWDKDARLVFCNEPYTHWAGRPRDGLLGRTVEDLFGEDAWEAARSAFGRALQGATLAYQRRLSHGPEAGRWARIQLCPDLNSQGEIDAVFTIAMDIHDDVMAREALSAARMRLVRFTENIPYPLTYVDRNFVLRFVNKAYTEQIGENSKNLVGRHVDVVPNEKSWDEHKPYLERALRGETIQHTRLVSFEDIGPRWMRTSYVPDADDDEAVLGVYTVTIDVHELTVTQEKLKRRVERDALTDVFSRRTMMDRVEAALSDARSNPVALFFVDLDGFKAVNDRLGHPAGDALLIAVGKALQGAVRSEDAVGRLGGDEFLVLASVRNPTGANALALHMLSAVRLAATGNVAAPLLPGAVSASIGYALAPADAADALALLQLADDAMYAAKRLGKDQAVHCASIPFDDTR